jgi:hypothetical protein
MANQLGDINEKQNENEPDSVLLPKMRMMRFRFKKVKCSRRVQMRIS